MSRQPVRRLPSRRITRRLSFSSPDTSKSKRRAFETIDNNSPKTPHSSPTNKNEEDECSNIPTTPKSTLSMPGSMFSHKDSTCVSSTSLNQIETHTSLELNSSPKTSNCSNIAKALMKSRRRLYMEQMFKERRAIRRQFETQSYRQNKDQVVFEFRGLRL